MPLIVVFAIVGGIAQFVDGSLGMGFGVTSATLLTLLGYSAVAASAGTHAAKMGTTFVSGLAHWREGNVEWRVLIALAAPGVVGAFTGAVILTNVSMDGARIWMAAILLLLGVSIVMRFAFGKSLVPQMKVRTRHLWPIGLVGGFVDATGGGGWGPVATPSMMTVTRHEPRKVVGTVNAAEFAVAVAASMGFLVGAKESQVPWGAVIGLIIGGLMVAPFAARFAGKAPRAQSPARSSAAW
ncbi:MAG: sulfite exporter TauE/SafE family protein [Micrococcales bacterium]|nr:sulfite exporter TauE/SafE family protein [Micrococcales bacterium]